MQEYVCAGSCLGLGWDLKDGLGFYLILLLLEAASYLFFKVWRRKEYLGKFMLGLCGGFCTQYQDLP